MKEWKAIRRILAIVGAMSLIVLLSGPMGCDKIAEAGSDAKEAVKSVVVDSSCCDELDAVKERAEDAEAQALELAGQIVSDQDWDELTALVKKKKKKDGLALIEKLRGE